jgi:Fanconi anemia group D2 protein
MVGKAPATKRSLERFIFEMKAFFHELGQQDVFWLGNLKHRDLSGNCVGSQVSQENTKNLLFIFSVMNLRDIG